MIISWNDVKTEKHPSTMTYCSSVVCVCMFVCKMYTNTTLPFTNNQSIWRMVFSLFNTSGNCSIVSVKAFYRSCRPLCTHIWGSLVSSAFSTFSWIDKRIADILRNCWISNLPRHSKLSYQISKLHWYWCFCLSLLISHTNLIYLVYLSIENKLNV